MRGGGVQTGESTQERSARLRLQAARETWNARAAGDTQAGETIQQRLARLRLQGAREDWNARATGSLDLATRSRLAQQRIADLGSANPANAYAASQEQRRAHLDKASLQASVAGPLPRNWNHVEREQKQRLANSAAAPDLLHGLAQSRMTTLQTMRPFGFQLPLSLLDSCLITISQLLYYLPGEDFLAPEDQNLLEYLQSLPAHMKERLMSLSAVLAPMNATSISALLRPPDQLNNTTNPEADELEWEEQAASEPGDPATSVDLSFSPIRMKTLRDLLCKASLASSTNLSKHLVPTLPFLNSLLLSGMANVQLNLSLLSILSACRNLQTLQLADLPCPTSLSPSQFLVRLSSSTPSLTGLNLSYNPWLDYPDLETVDWTYRWPALCRLALVGCEVMTPAMSRRASSGTGPRSGTLRKAGEKGNTKTHLAKEVWAMMTRKGSRLWVDVIL